MLKWLWQSIKNISDFHHNSAAVMGQIDSLRQLVHDSMASSSKSKEEYQAEIEALRRKVDLNWQTSLSIINRQSLIEQQFNAMMSEVEQRFQALQAQRQAQEKGGSGVIVGELLDVLASGGESPITPDDRKRISRTRTRDRLL